jgi:hypothetical protein
MILGFHRGCTCGWLCRGRGGVLGGGLRGVHASHLSLKPLHDPPSATSSRRTLQPGTPQVQFNYCAAHWWSE